MSSNINSTQTIVNFLTQTGATSYAEASRVFDMEVSRDALNLYSSAMTTLQQALAGYKWDDTTQEWVEITSNVQQRTNFVTVFSTVIGLLDSWSTMKTVDASGTQTDTGPQDIFLAAGEDPSSYINRIVRNSSSGGTITLDSTMNRYMAEALDRIVRTVRSAGWDPVYQSLYGANYDGLAAEQAFGYITGNTFWGGSEETKATYDIDSAMVAALNVVNSALIDDDATTQSESLQQLLMVDYISRGNELLFNEMATLKDAININQEVLTYLNSLQDLMNQKDPEHFLLKLQYLSGADEDMDWQTFEEETFSQDLGTTAKLPGFTEEEIAEYVSMIYNGTTDAFEEGETAPDGSGQAAGAFVNAATGIFEASMTTVINNLIQLKTELDTAAGDNGSALGQQIQKIIDDFNQVDDIQAWIEDYETGKEGEFQRHLNDAVVASQALNDTEREELRRVMFVYEEFYKSATAMLSKLTQLIERMASAISR